MGKNVLKSRKRKEQTIAIIAVFSAILIIIGAILIFAASKNENLGNSEHDHDHDHENNSATVNELTLKVAVDAYEGTPHYNAAVKFEEQVEAQTGGKVQVEVYAKGKLGDNKSLIHALEDDSDIVNVVIAPVSEFTVLDERMDISTLPFLFKNAESAWNFMSSDVQAEIEQKLLDKNVRVLTHYAGEMSCIISSSKVINNAADVTSMLFAINDATHMGKVLQLMKAQSAHMDNQMIYQALQQKKCDGFIGSLADVYENRFYQGQTYLVKTYHSYEAYAFAISESTWDKLGEYKKSVEEVARASAYTGRSLLEQKEREMLNHIQSSGVRVVSADMITFIDRVESYWRTYSSKYGNLLDKCISEVRMR